MRIISTLPATCAEKPFFKQIFWIMSMMWSVHVHVLLCSLNPVNQTLNWHVHYHYYSMPLTMSLFFPYINCFDCCEFPQITVRCCSNAVNFFTKIPTIDTPELACEGKIWGVYCEYKFPLCSASVTRVLCAISYVLDHILTALDQFSSVHW